ncbi:hypothetical protein ARMGADRAFT_1022965 [Armillaria gallica]|uniref:Uncharacterized protein n=1 Tax=Armillaria gallica TaxID=47427 RepID=A0A2H3EAV1_ARMGA|nr:hypothetical protein ARMGADRAFT_1022965 [Armillaria gallica]
MQFSIFQHLRAISTSVRLFHSGGPSSVSMSGQGYASSALARCPIQYLIDTFLMDLRLTVAEAPAEMEEEPLRSRSPVPVVEDKLTAVQVLRKIASEGTGVKPLLPGLVLVPAQGSQPYHGVPCAGV